jgi:hypothetical protein
VHCESGFRPKSRHHPHITCLQRYVETANLDKLYDAVGKVLAEETPTSWKLKVYKYYYIPFKNIGVAGIVIEPTDDLIRFQKKLIDAVAPFPQRRGRQRRSSPRRKIPTSTNRRSTT